MSDLQKLRARTRSDYGFFLDYRTRWYVSRRLGEDSTPQEVSFRDLGCILHTHGRYKVALKLTKVDDRNDNDMYGHVNNSVYSFL